MPELRGTATSDLASVRDDAFRLLAAAPANTDSPFRTPAMATIALAGAPSLRTVVLRAFDPLARTASIHTDVRVDKVDEVRRNPDVALHVWDAATQVQLRLDGAASVHQGDAVARSAWAALSPGTRSTYAVTPAPGSQIGTSDAYDRDQAAPDAAAGHFAVLLIVLKGMDWLCLAGPKHRRARFTWRGTREEAWWVVP